MVGGPAIRNASSAGTQQRRRDGVVALSEEHYGIHGTRAPETVGVRSSSGSVRLTNWDAETLAEALEAGTPIRFRDIPARRAS